MCCFILLYFILFYCYALDVCFLIKDRKGVDMDGRGDGTELGAVEGRDTVIRKYYIKTSTEENMY